MLHVIGASDAEAAKTLFNATLASPGGTPQLRQDEPMGLSDIDRSECRHEASALKSNSAIELPGAVTIRSPKPLVARSGRMWFVRRPFFANKRARVKSIRTRTEGDREPAAQTREDRRAKPSFRKWPCERGTARDFGFPAGERTQAKRLRYITPGLARACPQARW